MVKELEGQLKDDLFAGRMDVMRSKTLVKTSGAIDKAQQLNIEFQKLKLESEIEAKFIIKRIL